MAQSGHACFEMWGFFEGDALRVLRFRPRGIAWELEKEGYFGLLDCQRHSF